jgi:hypothetical protein
MAAFIKNANVQDLINGHLESGFLAKYITAIHGNTTPDAIANVIANAAAEQAFGV